jgi:hypothetical protein
MPLKLRARMNTPGLLSFMCPEEHTPDMGRDTVYHVQERSIKEGRYTIPE